MAKDIEQMSKHEGSDSGWSPGLRFVGYIGEETKCSHCGGTVKRGDHVMLGTIIGYDTILDSDDCLNLTELYSHFDPP